MLILFFDHTNKKFSFPMKNKIGKTTKTIDRCIQELFSKGITYIYDGRGSSTAKEQTDETFEIFMERLKREHPNAKYVSKYGMVDGIWCYKVETHNL